MTRIQIVIDQLDRLKAEYGDFAFRQAVRSIRQRRLDNGHRERRKRFPWSKYQSLYRMQRGVCPLCRDDMVLIRGRVEIDHKDPNREEGFNDDDNLQLTHRKCNRKKSSRSLYQQAKKSNRNIAELLGGS
ncbi:MAG: HNH endonuclease signature motif containing protein [Bacteroidota bacterium]|jgi:5-methylcytosine-specific restriction endonuclease McrA